MSRFVIYFETMAGTHLTDAVRALRDSGSADALYDHQLRAADPSEVTYEEFSIASDVAEGRRVRHARHALLFAAFAAEAYANDFLYDKRHGQDREALRRLPTVDKFALLPALSAKSTALRRGGQPLQTIKWLFQRRDELVHAAPVGRDLTYDPVNHNPQAAAKAIVAVAAAAATLNGGAPAGSALSHVVAERQSLLAYGERAEQGLPGIHDEPSSHDLLSGARGRD
ncbi:MAG TPA: hypothetical protein VN618_00080 [Solirubrobacteraceae bacterium]|nr:hypothetical protein [Solirubrobacteraceae bacterium]